MRVEVRNGNVDQAIRVLKKKLQHILELNTIEYYREQYTLRIYLYEVDTAKQDSYTNVVSVISNTMQNKQ